MKERAVRDEEVQKTARANPLDKFSLGIREMVSTMMIERMRENDAMVTRYMNEPDFQELVFAVLARNIYDVVGTGRPSQLAMGE